jgi:hypothetical protein
MKSTDKQIKIKVANSKRGKLFFPNDFAVLDVSLIREKEYFCGVNFVQYLSYILDKTKRFFYMESTENKIENNISRQRRGKLLFASDLYSGNGRKITRSHQSLSKKGYSAIAAYGQYECLGGSVCFEKYI